MRINAAEHMQTATAAAATIMQEVEDEEWEV